MEIYREVGFVHLHVHSSYSLRELREETGVSAALERAAKKWKPVFRETRALHSEIDQLFCI